MSSFDRISIPTVFIVLLVYGIVLFAPLCPVEVRKSEWRAPCTPQGACVNQTGYTEVLPPLLVLSSGFSWMAYSFTADESVKYEYSANQIVAVAFFLLPILVVLVLAFLGTRHSAEGKARTWRHVVLRRKTWRTCLWLVGLCFLLLSAFWAWSCLIFYGTTDSTSAIDPLLTSTIGTFLMSGLGFATMMLSVRSRAIWPDRSEDADD